MELKIHCFLTFNKYFFRQQKVKLKKRFLAVFFNKQDKIKTFAAVIAKNQRWDHRTQPNLEHIINLFQKLNKWSKLIVLLKIHQKNGAFQPSPL